MARYFKNSNIYFKSLLCILLKSEIEVDYAILNVLCIMVYTEGVMSTFIRGNNKFFNLHTRYSSLCIAGTVVRYLVVSIVDLFIFWYGKNLVGIVRERGNCLRYGGLGMVFIFVVVYNWGCTKIST